MRAIRVREPVYKITHQYISMRKFFRSATNLAAVTLHIMLNVTMGILLLLSPDLSEAEELLKNPGFEGHTQGGIAVGWGDNSGWADVDVGYELHEDAVEGTSQHIVGRRIARGAVQFGQKGIPLEKGKSYRISIWVKGKLDGPLEVMLRQHGRPYTVYARKTFRINEEWERYEFVATVIVDDPGAFFMIRLTGQGEIWLDNASVQKITEPGAVISPDEDNLVANGSFEVGLDRWAVKVRETGGYRNEMSVAFADVRPTLSHEKVPHGQQAMRIDVPPNGRVIITTPVFSVAPGYRYTLSIWLKGGKSRKVRIDVKSASSGARVRLGRTVDVGTRWKQYQFSTVLPATGGDRYHLIIESAGQGKLLLDGVQFAAGTGVDFHPRQMLEIGFIRTLDVPLYYKGDPFSLELCISAYQPLHGDYVLRVDSTDFNGKETELLEEQLSFDAASTSCKRFSHPVERTGHFTIRAEVNGADGLADMTTMAIGIVHRSVGNQNATSPFGGHARFSPASLKAMKKLGVSWLRMHPPLGTKWFVVEPEKGQFAFNDEPIRFARAQGFFILGSLDSTPRWASSAPHDIVSELADGFRAYPPNDISDWKRYVSRTVGHYKGIIDHWEVWNEPDSGGFLKLNGPLPELRKPETYVRLVESAYLAAKQANPKVTIVAGAGTGQPPSRWVEKLVKHGILDYIDALSFHFYLDGRPGDVLDVTTGERVAELRTLINTVDGRDIPIWETESGYVLETCGFQTSTDENSYCATPQESVAFIMRNYLEWIGNGVDHWFFYHMFFPDRTDKTRLSAFFDWDRSPKPLALGYATLSWVLRDSTFRKQLPETDGITGAEFAAADRLIRIFWSRDWSTRQSKSLRIPCSDGMEKTVVIDAMGNQIADCTTTESIELEVGIVPVFVVLALQ